MKIAISGRSGCGNSTVTKLVAERLGLRVINYTFKSIAEERGISFEEVCRLAEQDNEIDLEVDRKQIEMARESDCVLGSRLAIWLLREADLKVYLTAPVEVRAERIRAREGGSSEQVLEATRARDKRDAARYEALYGFDTEDFSFADLIIDAAEHDQFEIADLIVQTAERDNSRQ